MGWREKMESEKKEGEKLGGWEGVKKWKVGSWEELKDEHRIGKDE